MVDYLNYGNRGRFGLGLVDIILRASWATHKQVVTIQVLLLFLLFVREMRGMSGITPLTDLIDIHKILNQTQIICGGARLMNQDHLIHYLSALPRRNSLLRDDLYVHKKLKVTPQ
jgi:hypothetical protein